MKTFKSIGYEVELFLVNNKDLGGKNLIVYNAQRELREILGFAINPENFNISNWNRGYLRLDTAYESTLTTDGTPVEFSAFRGFGTSDDKYSGVRYFFDAQIQLINNIGAHLLRKFDLDWNCYRTSLNNVFDNPGQIFGSEKTIYNAYTGKSQIQKKKENCGMGDVTVRTTGLHLHFGFHDGSITNNQEKTDLIVRKLDLLLNDFDLGPNAEKREKEFQHKGIYRLKKQPNGVTTLEYRQLTPHMLLTRQVDKFIERADNVVNEIIT